jgi:hypothetical protein
LEFLIRPFGVVVGQLGQQLGRTADRTPLPAALRASLEIAPFGEANRTSAADALRPLQQCGLVLRQRRPTSTSASGEATRQR